MRNVAARVSVVFGVLGLLGACAAGSSDDDHDDQSSSQTSSGAVAGKGSSPSNSDTDSMAVAGSGSTIKDPLPAAGSSSQDVTKPDDEGCAANMPFKKEGCSCRAGETAACWTGPAADRNVGKCHDGLQICSSDSEFPMWGPCMGERLDCGIEDAGMPIPDAGEPPPPPPSDECECVPGAVIQCSEDCSVGIICSLTASKTCLPDKTWTECREDLNITLDLPGVQCRNMLHGCFDVLSDGTTQNKAEVYVGDCSSQFTCGHAPGLL